MVGFMLNQDVQDFQTDCGATASPKEDIVELFKHHNPDNSDFGLSLEGFLNLYATLASMNREAVWRDLISMGYTYQLKLKEEFIPVTNNDEIIPVTNNDEIDR